MCNLLKKSLFDDTGADACYNPLKAFILTIDLPVNRAIYCSPIDTFYKTIGYACLYKGYGKNVNEIPADTQQFKDTLIQCQTRRYQNLFRADRAAKGQKRQEQCGCHIAGKRKRKL